MRRVLILCLLMMLALTPSGHAEEQIIIFEDEFNAFYESMSGGYEVWGEEIPESDMLDEENAPEVNLPDPADTLAPIATTDEAHALATPDTPGYVFVRKLEYGSTGDDVAQMQTRLSALGYFNAKVTGGYYKQTSAAVKAFQKKNGLTSDGVAGRDTLTMLYDDALALTSADAPRPTATPQPLRYKLEIDVRNQITRAYELDENGEYTVLVREMICSTGTSGYETPIKTCTLPGKRARWGYFPKWDSHAQYLTRIDSSNAFHSVLYTSANTSALVESSYHKLGERASHGCVRLLVADAKWIYDNCPAGTLCEALEGEIYDPEYTMSLKPGELDYSSMLPRAMPDPTQPPTYDGVNFPDYTRLMKKSVQGADVYHLQMRLKELGYYKGTVTGGYYGGTIEAVKAFQRANGLDVDGAAGQMTVARLYAHTAIGTPDREDVVASQTPTPAPSPIATSTPPPRPTPQPIATTTPSPRPTPQPIATMTPTPTIAPTEDWGSMPGSEWLLPESVG